MQTTIGHKGTMTVQADQGIEGYALAKWAEEHKRIINGVFYYEASALAITTDPDAGQPERAIE